MTGNRSCLSNLFVSHFIDSVVVRLSRLRRNWTSREGGPSKETNRSHPQVEQYCGVRRVCVFSLLSKMRRTEDQTSDSKDS